MNKKEFSILVVEDDPELRMALSETLQIAGYRCSQAEQGQQALSLIDKLLESESLDMVITDNHMPVMDGETLLRQLQLKHPEIPVLMVTAYGSIDGAVAAMQLGAVDYLQKPFEAKTLLEKVANLLPDSAMLESSEVVAEDPYTKRIFSLAKRLAKSDATVMVLGESGTGKEVLANYIHRNSGRTDAAFVAINCAAIPDTMLESILFGYEKGAFTGAYQAKSGKFEQANGGTLLLDEISEMDISLQAKLLRVLQEQEVERIGGKETIPLDVRIIATSNRDLEKEVSEGRFREDLYYRLNVFPIKWRPLRERPLDIVPLAMRFIKRYQMGNGPVSLDENAKEYLIRQAWPGNVRELENVIQRAVILQQGGLITCDDFVYEADGFVSPAMDSKTTGAVDCQINDECHSDTGENNILNKDLKRREYQMIVDTLKSVGGHRNKTAEILGISPRTLRYKIAKMRDHGFSFDNLVEAS